MTLNHYIAVQGICARRKAVDLIKAGTITVNGVINYNPAYRVQEKDQIRYAGVAVGTSSAVEKIYILLYKPRGVITAVTDDRQRPTVIDIVRSSIKKRVFPVGRLDYETEGLLLLTNDGDFAQRLAHPSYCVKKAYLVTTAHDVTEHDFQQLCTGIIIDNRCCAVDAIAYDRHRVDRKRVIVTLHSGYNRVIRRLFGTLGHDIRQLVRIQYGSLSLARESLKAGEYRLLKRQEVDQLQRVQLTK